MKHFNPDDAPEGYIAIQGDGGQCDLCAFAAKSGLCTNPTARCLKVNRQDGHYAYFIKKNPLPEDL